MAGVMDFLFGKKALEKAAGKSKAKQKSSPAGIDVAKMAQEQADRNKKKKSNPVRDEMIKKLSPYTR